MDNLRPPPPEAVRPKDIATRMRGLRPPESLPKLAHPVLSLERIINAQPAPRDECLVTTTPLKPKDFKDGKFPPQQKDVDLRDVPEDIVPTQYEEPFQALLEGVLANMEVVPQELREEADLVVKWVETLQTDGKTGTSVIDRAPTKMQDEISAFMRRAGWNEEEIALYFGSRQRKLNAKELGAVYERVIATEDKILHVKGQGWKQRGLDKTRAVARAFKQAYRLHPYETPAPGHSIRYPVQFDKDTIGTEAVVPPDGVIMVHDPLFFFVQETLAPDHLDTGYHTVDILNKQIRWMVDGQRYPTSTDFFADIMQPSRREYKPKKYPYDPTADGAFENIRVETQEEMMKKHKDKKPAVYDFLNAVNLTLEYIYDPNKPLTNEDRNTRVDQAVKNMAGGKFERFVKGTGEIAQSVALTLDNLKDYATQSKDITSLATIKALLTGLDPSNFDYGSWLIRTPDGKMAYLRDELRKRRELDKGNEMRQKSGENLQIFMDAWGMAAKQAKTQGIETESALVTSTSSLFKPLELEKGGEWKPVSTADSFNMLDEWLDAGREFPPKTPDQAARLMYDAFGMKVTSNTTERDLILMTRKAMAALLPIYPDQDTFMLKGMDDPASKMHQYGGYEGTLKLLKDFTTTLRQARPIYQEVMKT